MRIIEIRFNRKIYNLSLEYGQTSESLPSNFVCGSSAIRKLEIIQLYMYLDVLMEQRNRQEENSWLYLSNVQHMPTGEYSDLKEYDIAGMLLLFKSCGGLDALSCIRNEHGSLLEMHMPAPWRRRMETSLYLDRQYCAPLL